MAVTAARGSRIALLIIVSDEPELHAPIRAGQRELWRWASGDDVDPVRGDCEFSGDPASADTYRWAEDAESVTAVISLRGSGRVEKVASAVRQVRPDAAILMLCEGCDATPGDGTLAPSGRLRDVLRLDLEEELQRLEAERRLHRLRVFADDAALLPILVHHDPDPDALSAASALRFLLGRTAESTPVLSLGSLQRAENTRMADLLGIVVSTVTVDDLRGLPALIAVDTQPPAFGGEERPRLAVIDHHPLESSAGVEFLDIRPELGATATMMTQYARADEDLELGAALAAALLHGIRTDTALLTRGVTPADVDAYADLQQHADAHLLRRFERPALESGLARRFGRAVAESKVSGGWVVAVLDADRDEIHVLSDLADFCMRIDGVRWAAACAPLEDELVIALRHVGGKPGAGVLARRLSELGGSGGGHRSMARVALPMAVAKGLGLEKDDDLAGGVLRVLIEVLENGQPKR
jgi:nanoRNase/pAp phosphatase (c-di-AMP/oligoRNAs hydrolase)